MWSYRYAINLARYKEKVKAYKAGLPIPDISDAQAKELYDGLQKAGIHHTPPPEDLTHAINHIDMDTSAADDDKSSGYETPEPTRQPTPLRIHRSSKRRDGAEKSSATLRQANEITPPPSKKVSLPPTLALAEGVSKSFKKDRKMKSRKSEIKDLEAVEIKPSAFYEPIFAAKQDSPGKYKKSKRERKSEGGEYWV